MTSFFLLEYNPGTQQYAYPRRGGIKLSGTCIVHTSESVIDHVGPDASAEDCARFIGGRADYGSYHYLCDSDSGIWMLPWEYEAWQDSETNNWAVGISAAVRAAEWLTIESGRRDRIYRNLAAGAADFVIYMRDAYNITVPLRRITGAEARARVPGFCAHGDSGIARSDPGANFDWARFFAYTAEAINSGGILPQGTTQEDDDMFTPEEKALLFGVLDKLNARTATLPGQQDELQYWADLIGAVDKINGGVADLQSRPAADIAAQINAAGLAVAVRDELVKLISGQ